MAYQTSTNLYENSIYIVDGAGTTPYATIQAAIDVAQATGNDETIFIREGTYVEDLTLYTKVSLVAFNEQAAVVINGVHTPPNAGSLSFTNIYLDSATHIFSSAAAGTTSIFLVGCTFELINGYIFNLTNWTGVLSIVGADDGSTDNGVVLNTGGSAVFISECNIGRGNANSMAVSGNMNSIGSTYGCPVTFTGAGVSYLTGCYFDLYTMTAANTATVYVSTCTFESNANSCVSTTSANYVFLSGCTLNSSNVAAVAGTGSVQIVGCNFSDSHDTAAALTLDENGTTMTGEIHALNIENMLMTGFYDWAAAAPYFDDTLLGTFDLLVGGTGYIGGHLVTWVPQATAGMTSGSTWWIYIDEDGTIGKTNVRTGALFLENIVLFECLYDETVGVKLQHTVRENHPYSFSATASNYLHESLGTIIEDHHGGANITIVGPGNIKISITGADELLDHGLDTTIPDSAGVGVVFKQFYTDGAGKWAIYTESDTFDGYYNNAGATAVIPANKFGIYTLYVSKDSGNAATPTYVAVLNDAYYNTAGGADTAIANGLNSQASAELASLELAQLGYIIWQESIAEISDVIISKSTATSSTSTGGTNVAALVTTSITNFDGILSAADTTVQTALDTIDDWGAGTTDHAVLIGNGVGVAIGALAVGGTGTILTGNVGADPAWTTATYPETVAIGDVLVASAADVIGVATGATTATHVLTANGAGTAPTFQAPAGGGLLPWAVAVDAALALVGDNGYICNRGTAVTATLPAAMIVGQIIRITGIGAGLTVIAQRANQSIHFGDITTTVGVGGSLTATEVRDSIEMVCVVADLEFNVLSAMGNWEYV